MSVVHRRLPDTATTLKGRVGGFGSVWTVIAFRLVQNVRWVETKNYIGIVREIEPSSLLHQKAKRHLQFSDWFAFDNQQVVAAWKGHNFYGGIVSRLNGERWDVRLDYVRQFKTDYVQQLEGLVFEKKKFIYQLG